MRMAPLVPHGGFELNRFGLRMPKNVVSPFRHFTRAAAAFAFAVVTGFATSAAAQQADLVVNQLDSPDPGPAGGVFTYTVRVDNNGPNAAIGVTFSDTLPPGSTFIGAVPTAGSCGAPVAGVLSCALGNLAFLSNATVTLRVRLPTPGVWTDSTCSWRPIR